MMHTRLWVARLMLQKQGLDAKSVMLSQVWLQQQPEGYTLGIHSTCDYTRGWGEVVLFRANLE